MLVANDSVSIFLSHLKWFQREPFSCSLNHMPYFSKDNNNCNLKVAVSDFENLFLLATSMFLDARCTQMQEWMIYLGSMSLLPEFSMCACILLKLHPNDSKLQLYKIFCSIFFFLEIENWETLIAIAAL